VPARALYGIFTTRARETFGLSGYPPHPALVRAYARIKKAAAVVNARLRLLPRAWARALGAAADRVIEGNVPDAAALDIFQAGAGTPAHMNVNEVIANLANERLGGRRGTYAPIHPNNHVNLGQSSNDVTPTAIRLMALELLPALVEEARALAAAFRRLAARERDTVKPGRTHLQDAVPITYGQVFDGYAHNVDDAAAAVAASATALSVIPLGGTAVGTGLNTHPRFAVAMARELSRLTGVRLTPTPSPVGASWSLRPLLACSAALRGLAIDVGKICFDLRLLASGPHAGLAEITLPEVEPGSSIMPGKVNPSVPEAVQMACFRVRGNDHTIALAAAAGELELNVMTPVVAHALGESFDLMARALRLLRERAVEGLTVDRARVDALVRGSLVQATGLSPYLGYEVTAELVNEALQAGRPFADVVREHDLVPPRALARLLAPAEQTRPRPVDVGLRQRIQSAPVFRAYRDRLAS